MKTIDQVLNRSNKVMNIANFTKEVLQTVFVCLFFGAIIALLNESITALYYIQGTATAFIAVYVWMDNILLKEDRITELTAKQYFRSNQISIK